jgi:hypothetical protein
MPPTRLALQVSIVSSRGRVLALRRSHAVESVPGYWALGANETLVPPSPSTTPGAPAYSLFDLAERCLAEECGLTMASPFVEYGEIYITWFGVNAHPGEGVAQSVIALTTTGLPESEVVQRIRNAHSNFETDAIEWIPFSRQALSKALRDPNRRWINFSHVVVGELLRYRELINRDLDRWHAGQ